MEGANENLEQVQMRRSTQRRSWSPFEEEALLSILEDLVAKGHRCDAGSFKPGTLNEIAAQLKMKCPNSNLQAYPHIESKLKKLKSNYSCIYDMINTSGFAWNDIKKCIEVDTDEAWENYVKHNKGASAWRNKPYPIYERLAIIFGKDRANGRAAEVPAEMMEEDGDNTANDDEVSPISVNNAVSNAASHKSEVSKKLGKRKRTEDEKLISDLSLAIIESGKALKDVANAIIKGNEVRSDIRDEIKKMGLPIMEQIEAMRIIMDKPQTISLFMSMDDEMRQAFVDNLLIENNPLRGYSGYYLEDLHLVKELFLVEEVLLC